MPFPRATLAISRAASDSSKFPGDRETHSFWRNRALLLSCSLASFLIKSKETKFVFIEFISPISPNTPLSGHPIRQNLVNRSNVWLRHPISISTGARSDYVFGVAGCDTQFRFRPAVQTSSKSAASAQLVRQDRGGHLIAFECIFELTF